MSLPLVGGFIAAALALIGIGLWAERPRRRAILPLDPDPVIRPVSPPRLWWTGFRQAAAHHPAPGVAALETGLWVLALAALVTLIRAPRAGGFAFFIWAITIIPHEVGHVVCSPFGWFLWVAGGSIWQVLIFVLPALWAFYVRRQVTVALLFWTLAGYSLVNLAVYIGDAGDRDLPLLLGMSKDHHDWWNLLRTYGLLEYDHLLATLTTILGTGIVLASAVLGTLAAWVMPRPRHFAGGFWRALRDALHPGAP